MDYCPGGEIFTYLRRYKKFEEPTAQFYAAEVTMILEFLHEKEGVAYRDLKPENILIDADGHLKLVDFGFAKKLDGRQCPPHFKLLHSVTDADCAASRPDIYTLRHSGMFPPPP